VRPDSPNGAALAEREGSWRVLVSPEALQGGESVAGHQLFPEGIPQNVEVCGMPELHLRVSVRSHRAQFIGGWVNNTISDSADDVVAGQIGADFPVVLTRDLARARQWLADRAEKTQRTGLLAVPARSACGRMGWNFHQPSEKEFPIRIGSSTLRVTSDRRSSSKSLRRNSIGRDSKSTGPVSVGAAISPSTRQLGNGVTGGSAGTNGFGRTILYDGNIQRISTASSSPALGEVW